MRRETIFPMYYPQPGGLKIGTPMPKSKVFVGGREWGRQWNHFILVGKETEKAVEELG